MDNQEMNQEGRGMYVCGNYTCMVHVIKPGDTLYRLSREYGVKVSALMMANPFVDIYNLRIGDELCIPRVRRPDYGSQMTMPRMSKQRDRATDNSVEWMPNQKERMMPQESLQTQNDTVEEEAPDVEPVSNERVIDAEINYMKEQNGFIEPECPECSGMKYQNNGDTY